METTTEIAATPTKLTMTCSDLASLSGGVAAEAEAHHDNEALADGDDDDGEPSGRTAPWANTHAPHVRML